MKNIYLEEKSLYRFGVFTSKNDILRKVIFPVFKPKIGVCKNSLRWIHAHLRRYLHLSPPSPAALKVGGITLDDDARAVTVNDKPVSLTPLEYDILKFLMQHPCKVFSPQEIYRQVWREPPAAENSVAVHIRHIREKIEVDPSNPRYVTVVWGKGYKIEAGV